MSTVATTTAILPSFAFFLCLALFATNLYPSNTVYYVLSFLSARLAGSSSAGSSAGSLQCEKKQRQQASKKWRTPSGRKEIIDKYPLL